ncbi:MAG: glycosyltransferase [Puniceicoccales bacterium]|nr:glycosyltransferase [Puniceicoccales bacterium]
MKILKVIHGYPLRYNAGSEVYSQTLCHGLAAAGHEVHVFTREEDSFAPDFRLREERDADNPRVTLHLVNNPRLNVTYRAAGIDRRFAEVLDATRPGIVHIGHLNHLSTSLLREAAIREIPIVFTLHDYWLMCPRGQFMQFFPEKPDELWAACDGQEDHRCAGRCFARFFSGGGGSEHDADVRYWTDWVARRMRHVREMCELVDRFIAPAHYLSGRFRNDFQLPDAKLAYLDYGFDTARLRHRQRVAGEPFVFGYIGTHIPAKGIHDLIRAFGKLPADNVTGGAILRIWGRPRGQETAALKAIAAALPPAVAARVEWRSEYENKNIVSDVFNHCDAIVVPSVWVENSPLVIHEAQQVRVPVITAAAGGMAEYVRHEVNGLLFKHRDVDALAEQMRRLASDPALARELGARGYLFSETGDIPNITKHVRDVEKIYAQVLRHRDTARVLRHDAPWRVTFDTNPDSCNMHCVMCEEHSEHSPLRRARVAGGIQSRLMPFALIERVVAEAAPRGLREIIPSTMGEPLLYADFEKILALCRQYGVKLNLTTNGTFPRLGARAWAERIVPVASDVKISWNGATRETYDAIMRGGNWERAIANVREFVAVRDTNAATGGHRCRVTFQLTFMERNVGELAAMVRLAASLGVDRVKGHHLWAHFAEIKNESLRRDAGAIARWNAAVADARAAAGETPLPNGRHVLLENIFPLDATTGTADLAPGGQCPFLGQEAWVSATGRFNPCCAPDAQRQTLGNFGNLSERGFFEIWDGPAYRELVASYRNHRLCLSCNMRKPPPETAAWVSKPASPAMPRMQRNETNQNGGAA